MVRGQKNSAKNKPKPKINRVPSYANKYNNNNNNYHPQAQQYYRPAQQQYYQQPQQHQYFHPQQPNPVQVLQHEFNRIRQQQQEQFLAQQCFEEQRKREQREVDQLKNDLIKQQANLEKDIRNRFNKELETRNKELNAKIEKEVASRLETLKKQHESELKALAASLENSKKDCMKKECQKSAGTKSTSQDSKNSELKEQQRKCEARKQEMEKDRAPKSKGPTAMRAAHMEKETILITVPNDKIGSTMNGHGQSRIQSNGQNKQNGSNPPLRAILGNSASHRPNAPSVDADSSAARPKRPLHPRVLYPGQMRPTSVSVNDRLKLKAPPQATTPVVTPITPPDSPENAKTEGATQPEDVLRVTNHAPKINNSTPNTRKTVNFKFNPTYDAVSSLNLYCEAHGFEKPTFNIFNTPPRLNCSVRIEGDVYSSYPQEFANEEAAYQRTAQIAIERIKHAESRQRLSVCMVNNDEFIEGLYQELLKYPHGILGHKLEDWYGRTFGHHLPSNWYDLIIESNKIRVEHGINPRIILFANDPGSPVPIRINTPATMPELVLPWQVNEDGSHDWNMYISHCISTTEVWVRLIDQIEKLDELTTHMSRHMAVPHYRQQVLDPHVQELYLVEIREGWNRVRVISVDAEQKNCRCHFVDFGDIAQFSFEELFQCPAQFLVLPAQAICLSLYALDKFRDHPHAQRVLITELEGQTVVARVLTSQKQFLELGGAAQGIVGKGRRQACLVATLYDTSTAEDVHLNDLVASRIIKTTPPPTLNDEQNIGKTTPIFVTHITEDGDLMVLLRNDDLNFVERSIATTVVDLGENDRVQYADLLHDRHVFVCDESVGGQKQWYRGRLVAKPQNPEEETFDIYYIDDGRQRKTHISNVYRLEANNRALASYPPQALPVRLYDVPQITNHMMGRLRTQMPPRSEALLKVVAKDVTKPLVKVYIRQGPESMYSSVNTGLRMEFEIQSTTRQESLDDLQSNTSVQMPRRGSFSSVVSSQSSSSDLVAFTSPSSPQKASPKRSGATTFSTLLLKDYEAIPAVGAYFEVRVSLSINPGHFAVQPYKFYNQLQFLMKDLQEYCKGKAAKGVEPSQLAIGEAYAAPDSEGVYHRVNIRKIYDEIIHVSFVDVGDDGVVACDQLKTLPPEFRELPKMALPAQLYGIKLADVVWSHENCVRFRKLTLGKMFIGIVRCLQKQKDETRALCLELIDTSTPKDIKMHEILITENHAQPETKEV
ncbi:tudor domain-containing protein 7B isoform X2 [Drosophila kikkawai]|nr:tudor domain-containing protein 7B isoform X2 [Drosophila kikkawai]XP_017025170.1 tudor domain-containing protein 7B isoform X2 [Drosophila kikkawai]